MRTLIIVFGICSLARCVTIFRTTMPIASCGRNHLQSLKLILQMQNHLYSYIGELPSDFTRLRSSDKGWLGDLGLGRLVLTAYLLQNERSKLVHTQTSCLRWELSWKGCEYSRIAILAV